MVHIIFIIYTKKSTSIWRIRISLTKKKAGFIPLPKDHGVPNHRWVLLKFPD